MDPGASFPELSCLIRISGQAARPWGEGATELLKGSAHSPIHVALEGNRTG